MERWLAFNCKFKDNRIKIKELIKIIYGDIYFFSRAYEVNRNRLISWFAGTDSSDVEAMIGYFLDCS